MTTPKDDPKGKPGDDPKPGAKPDPRTTSRAADDGPTAEDDGFEFVEWDDEDHAGALADNPRRRLLRQLVALEALADAAGLSVIDILVWAAQAAWGVDLRPAGAVAGQQGAVTAGGAPPGTPSQSTSATI